MLDECLFINSKYSLSSLNKGSKTSCNSSLQSILFKFSIKFSNVTILSFSDNNAAPIATYNSEFLGIIYSPSFKFKVSINLFVKPSRKCSGPPKKATLPRIGFPQASPLIVWFTTAWKIDAAISLFLAPSLIRGWISVFANTPHLDAIGYIIFESLDNSFTPFASVFNNTAIWSMNAPVPPAQVPFILWSIPSFKYVIFASSPPSSITTSVLCKNSSTAFVHDITSCSKLTLNHFDTAIPPDPVTITLKLTFPILSIHSFSTLFNVFLISERCLL